MSTYSKAPLSASTHGRGIKVTTVAPIDGSDTTIHQAVNSATDYDLITILAINNDTVTRTLSLGWGGTTAVDDIIAVDLPALAGLILVTADLFLRNNLTVVASASAANVISIFGDVKQVRA